MALLSDAGRRDVWAALMRSALGPCAATKPQLRAAVDAADVWVESHVADFAAVLPESIRAVTPSHTLLANSAGIARDSGPPDVSAGIADRNQSNALLAGYNAASVWLTANVTGYLTAVAQAGAGSLTTAQSLAVLESVCRRRAI